MFTAPRILRCEHNLGDIPCRCGWRKLRPMSNWAAEHNRYTPHTSAIRRRVCCRALVDPWIISNTHNTVPSSRYSIVRYRQIPEKPKNEEKYNKSVKFSFSFSLPPALPLCPSVCVCARGARNSNPSDEINIARQRPHSSRETFRNWKMI